MTYYRLYKIALENIKFIAAEMLRTATYPTGEGTYVKYWYTSDDKEFTNKSKAIEHQISWLLEEILI
jgi:hypothetical protein